MTITQLDSPSRGNRIAVIHFRSFERISERASIDVLDHGHIVYQSLAGLPCLREPPAPNLLLTLRHLLAPTLMRPQTGIIDQLLVFISFPRSLILKHASQVTSVVQEGPWKQLHYQDHEPYVSVDANAPLQVFP